jgi:hypothetical protein
LIDSELVSRIAHELNLSVEEVKKQESDYATEIRPKIELRYLSHLVTTIEDMVNEKRVKAFLNSTSETGGGLSDHFRTKTVRLYSIILTPIQFKRRATTRHHKSGAIIFFNASFPDSQKRILIAHELGHIVNKELLVKADSESLANLFAFFALNDKNDFYLDEAKKYTFPGRGLEILNSIKAVCPDLPVAKKKNRGEDSLENT